MSAIYGHKWLANFGENDATGTWAAALSDLNPDQIGQGLDACVREGDEWPPALPKFRQMCLGITPKDIHDLSDAELVRACHEAGIETLGRSRKQLESSLTSASGDDSDQRLLQ